MTVLTLQTSLDWTIPFPSLHYTHCSIFLTVPHFPLAYLALGDKTSILHFSFSTNQTYTCHRHCNTMMDTDSSYEQDSNCTTELHTLGEYWGGAKRIISSKSWLNPLWMSMVLDWGSTTQISRNLEQFFHFGNFLHKKQSFPPYAQCHMALAFARGLQIQKSLHFQIFHDKLWFLVNSQEIWAGFEPSRGQKHSKGDLTTPILTHGKQSWEFEVLEGQMTSKFKNSTWVGK